jgi:chloramphenicol 3-O phosphotransferase
VVADVCHHEGYSRPLHILPRCAGTLLGLSVLFVGVRCPIEVIWERRELSWGQRREVAGPELVAAVGRWQAEVHAHGGYDVEIDTSILTPKQCVQAIAATFGERRTGTAFERLAQS